MRKHSSPVGTWSSLKALPDVPVFKGIGCGLFKECFYRQRNSMEEHLPKKHPDEWGTMHNRLLTKFLNEIPLQTLFLGNQARYFSVHEKDEDGMELGTGPEDRFHTVSRNLERS